LIASDTTLHLYGLDCAGNIVQIAVSKCDKQSPLTKKHKPSNELSRKQNPTLSQTNVFMSQIDHSQIEIFDSDYEVTILKSYFHLPPNEMRNALSLFARWPLNLVQVCTLAGHSFFRSFIQSFVSLSLSPSLFY
jgi:hypothetical protein